MFHHILGGIAQIEASLCIRANCIHPSSLSLSLPKILSRRLSTSDVCDDRNTFPLLSLPLRLPNPILRCEFPKSHRNRATWKPENSHGQPVLEALFDDDQDKQGTSEGEGKERRLQRQRNMFATYSFLIPTPSTLHCRPGN